MVQEMSDPALQKTARLAGFFYFLIIASSLLSMIFLGSKLTVPHNPAATIQHILVHEPLFRLNLLYEIIMYASVIVLAFVLYLVLKTVDKKLAHLALLWRMGEAILGCLSVLTGMVILQVLHGESYAAALGTEKVQALAMLLLEVKKAIIPIVFVFLSLGTIVYCYLFFKSRYIPAWLSLFGLVSFSLLLVATLTGLVLPLENAMVFGVLAILFELMIGLWLMIKGVKLDRQYA